MKTLFALLITLFASSQAFADSTFLCKLKPNEYWAKDTVLSIRTSEDLSEATLNLEKGEFYFELAGVEPELTLISQGKSRLGWDVATYESLNYDDTQFLFVFATDEERTSGRLGIQILVEGLDGGTIAHAIECYAE